MSPTDGPPGSPAEPGREAVGDDEPVSAPQQPAPASPNGPKGRSRRQTAFDMVLSLVVILAVVGVVLLLAPQPGAVEQPQVADADAVLAADEAALMLGRPPLLLRPASDEDATETPQVVELGEDWRLDYVRTEVTDEVGTWRVGVLSPGERRVDLEQAVEPTEEWLTRADAGEPGLPEPVTVGGLTWTKQVRGDGRTTYSVEEPDGLTTALTASSDSDDLQEVVGLVSGRLAD